MDRNKEQYKRQLDRSRNWKRRNPERHAELARAYRTRNREKTKAQNQLNYAIRKGEIVRQPCEGCGTSEKVHAHHHDYSKPFEVKWLCYLCHKKSHPVDDEDKKIKFKGAKYARLPGELNPNSSLTNKEVEQIRKMLELGLSQESIGRAMNVSQVTISRIKRNLCYKSDSIGPSP